jgi:hypothetical protein
MMSPIRGFVTICAFALITHCRTEHDPCASTDGRELRFREGEMGHLASS